MKECRYCKKVYPESLFGIALTTKDKIYYRHKCKFCYQSTKNILKKKYKDYISEYKVKKKCSDCGNGDHRVLEFHHRDKSEKEFSISFAYDNRYGINKIMEEIKKCDILCANCHRIRHWQENRW